MRLALSLAPNGWDAYRHSSPELRQLWHEAVFEKIVVRERKIARVEYQEPSRSLLPFFRPGL